MRYDLRSYTGFDDRISDFSNRPNEFIAEQIMALAQAKGEAFFSKDFLFDLRLLRKPTALEVLTAFAEHMAKDKETMRFYVRAVADTYINIMNKDTNRPKEVEMAKQYIATIKVMWERWLLQGAKPIVLNIVSDSKMETVVRDMQLISAATGLRDQGIKDQVSEFLSQNPDELVGKIAKEVGSASRAVASFYAMRRIKSQELLYHLEQGRKFAPNFFSVSKGIKIKFSDGLIINFSKPHTDYVTVSITANLNAGQKKELFSQIAKAIGVKSPDAAMLSPYQGSDSFGASEAFKIYAHLIDTKTGDSFVSSDLDVIIKKGPLRTRAVGILSKVGLVVKKSEGVWGLMRVDKNSAYELLVGKDKAMASLVRGQVDFKKAPGGIDLNAKHMGLDIVKETEGVTARFNPDIVAEFRRGDFLGIVPVIIRITPISNLLPLLGIEANPN